MKNKLVTFKKKVPIRMKNLSWLQAKARFPLLKPYGNADGDRLTNSRDCKPFDINRQGEDHKNKIILKKAVERESGYLYYVDGEGNLCNAKLNRGSTKGTIRKRKYSTQEQKEEMMF